MDDVHATARRVARDLLGVLGFNSRTDPDLDRLVDGVELTGPRTPILPSPWRITDLMAGTQVALAVVAQLVSKSRLGETQRASVDTAHATMFIFQGHAMHWSEAGGTGRLIELLRKITVVPPPEGTYPQFLNLTGNSYMCKDRWIYVFSSFSPADAFLKIFGFSDAEVAQLLDYSHCVPDYVDPDWPRTWERQRRVIAAIKAKCLEWNSWDLQAAFHAAKVGAVCVPLSGDEFDASEQGKALRSVPPIDVLKVEGWDRAPLGKLDAAGRERGLLSGIKVLELTRVLMGPVVGLNLANYGATSIRVASATVADAPMYSFAMNTNKRSVFLDLKDPADKQRFTELLMDADVLIQNNAYGAVERLGFGFQDVLNMVKNRKKGIIYVEGNSYGFNGPMAGALGFEQLGQMLSGLCKVNGEYQIFEPAPDPSTGPPPAVLPCANCDVNTGTFGALGAVACLVRREREGGSYRVRVSLTRTAMVLRDLGPYEDKAALAKLMASYPPYEISYDPSSPHHGINFINHFYLKLLQARPEFFDPRNGFWQSFKDSPFGGTVTNIRAPITFGTTPAKTRIAPRPLGHDTLAGGWEEPTELVKEEEGFVYRPIVRAGAEKL
ncbi:CoA-transferase family III domain-containing protein [Hyaloraphidium curvatum]|nr:CoA-transferase family III domain-containing protein [Hyaloraphidium curvatum]